MLFFMEGGGEKESKLVSILVGRVWLYWLVWMWVVVVVLLCNVLGCCGGVVGVLGWVMLYV